MVSVPFFEGGLGAVWGVQRGDSPPPRHCHCPPHQQPFCLATGQLPCLPYCPLFLPSHALPHETDKIQDGWSLGLPSFLLENRSSERELEVLALVRGLGSRLCNWAGRHEEMGLENPLRVAVSGGPGKASPGVWLF